VWCHLTRPVGLICCCCSSARSFALRLPFHGRSPSRSCLRLVLPVSSLREHGGARTGDFNPMSSRPCWAYTTRCSGRGTPRGSCPAVRHRRNRQRHFGYPRVAIDLSTYIWTEYLKHRARSRGFDLAIIEHILRFSPERYLDTVTRRMVAVGGMDIVWSSYRMIRKVIPLLQ
jgi:hypothetical protein